MALQGVHVKRIAVQKGRQADKSIELLSGLIYLHTLVLQQDLELNRVKCRRQDSLNDPRASIGRLWQM